VSGCPVAAVLDEDIASLAQAQDVQPVAGKADLQHPAAREHDSLFVHMAQDTIIRVE
jgi:hypothetical protein